MDSKPFLDSTFSNIFLSSSSFSLAFLNNSSIYVWVSLSFGLVMVIFLETPLLFSTAVTFKILFSSSSYVTSIYGIPLGMGGMPSRLN